MIYYLIAQRNVRTVHEFLASWGKALVDRITVLTFEEIFSGRRTRFGEGTYIFTSFGASLGAFDPPSPARKLAVDLHRRLVDFVGPARVLNDPVSFLRRYELLQALSERGINRFAAHRVLDGGIPRRYPVFLRHAEGTKWDTPPVLNDAEEYRAAAAAAEHPEGLLAIELCDTADSSGVYRRYSCFRVGERIVPRHLFFSRNWWVKEADLHEPAMVEEEIAFLESNPHADFLAEVCRIARCAYGRIDYALLDGKPQVWEINDTPLIAGGLSSEISARQAVHRKFVALFSAALNAIDPPGEGRPSAVSGQLSA